jgi:hypothetical protein
LLSICLGGCMEREDRAGRPDAAVIDPVGLVRQYVKRDANGERLGPNPWFQEVVTWPQEPAYDSYTVIRGYAVEPPPRIAGSPAKIPVRYDVIGWIVPEAGRAAFLEQEKEEVFEFVVLLTDDGWRIDEPQIDQHVLATVAAASKALTQEDAARISELAAAAPAEP